MTNAEDTIPISDQMNNEAESLEVAEENVATEELETRLSRRDEVYGIMSGSENDSLASYPGHQIAGSEDIRCICDTNDDDGFTIQCEDCLVWQHALCVGISKENVPESYFCELCRPELHHKEGYWIVGSMPPSGSGRKRKVSQAIPINKLLSSEISESTISQECIPGFEFLAKTFYEEKLSLMSGQNVNWASFNFEFSGNLIAFPDTAKLKASVKNLEVREIRGRGAQRKSVIGSINYTSMKLGVFVAQDIDPGVLITEYLGHVQVTQLLGKKVGVHEKVQQSFLLFIPNLRPNICIDARNAGSLARHIRRSCRPNCEVKLVLTGGQNANNVHVCIFAKNSVLENEELFLPIDFEHGNDYFRYECACGNAELCLGPEGSIPAPKQKAASYEMVDSSRPYQRAKTPQQSSGQSSSFLATAAAGQKLSREERKLLQYIEQIEKMDSAEHKKASRKSSSMASSSTANVGGSRSPSNKPSPKRSPGPSDSPRKTSAVVNKPIIEEAEEDTTATDESNVVVESAVKKAKVGSGRPLKSPKKKPVKSTGTKKKPKIVSDEDQEDERVFEDEAADVDIGKPDVYTSSNMSHDDVDINVRTASPFSVSIDRSSTISPFSSHTPPSCPTPIEESTSQTETPSKKRVSLSDYMKKRKATGEQGREEGEITVQPDRTQSTPYAAAYIRELPVFTRPEPIAEYSGEQRAPAHYEMPPHLTPPPPLATSSVSMMMDIDYPTRSESASAGTYYSSSRHERKPSGSSSRYPEANVGIARYGYQSSQTRGSMSDPNRPPSHHQTPSSTSSYEPQQTLYKPRPSLLKAAQDLPTRWEEASRSDRDRIVDRTDYYASSSRSAKYESYGSGRRAEYEDKYDHRRSYPSGVSHHSREEYAASSIPPASLNRPAYEDHRKYSTLSSSSTNPPYNHPDYQSDAWRRPSSSQSQQQQQSPPPLPRHPPNSNDPRQPQGGHQNYQRR